MYFGSFLLKISPTTTKNQHIWPDCPKYLPVDLFILGFQVQQDLNHLLTRDELDLDMMDSIISEYGQINMGKLQMECEDFYKAEEAQQSQCDSQNNQMMAKCIMKTLSASTWMLLSFFNKIEYNNVVYVPLLQKHKKVTALAIISSVAIPKTSEGDYVILCHRQRQHQPPSLIF